MKEALDLSCKYMGLNLKSPLIIGSCGLTYSLEKIKKMEDYGVGAVVMKSVFEEQIISETSKSLDELDSDYVHSEAMGYIKIARNGFRRKIMNFITELKEGKHSVVPVSIVFPTAIG